MAPNLSEYGQKIRELVSGAEAGAEPVGDSTDPTGNAVSPSAEPDAEPRGGLPDYDPENLRSRRHFLTEVGLSADEFFQLLIEDEGGTLRQKRFTEFTNLSSSTISRILQEMEEDEQIVRMRIGRENVVYLPEHAPSDDFPPGDEAEGKLRA